MSENQDPDSKTEDPTGKRLDEARSKGQVVKTAEANNLAVLSGALVLLLVVFPWSFGNILTAIRPFIERPHGFPVDYGSIGVILTELSMEIGLALIVPFAILVAMIILASYIQVGWLYTTEAVFNFNLGRLNPWSALKQKFSVKNLVEFGKSFAKMLVVSTVITPLILPLWGSVDHFIALSLESIVLETKYEAQKLIFGVVLILLVLAVADYKYQHHTFMRDMRMTKQEVKDEHKQQEGDPLVKSKIRELRFKRARARMMSNVPMADVVITNPTHFAVALKYDPGSMGAPVLLAKGADLVAQKIRELAKEHDIPIISNPPLARALYATTEVNQEIPAEHYRAVAQIISYVFKLKQKPMPN